MTDPIPETAKQLTEHSRQTCWELAKCLFAANTGAAAGLFLLLRSEPNNAFCRWAFVVFCFGTFSVVFSYFLGAVHAVEVAEGFQRDYLGGEDRTQTLQRHNARVWGWKPKAIALGGWLSFVSFAAGGVIAGISIFAGAASVGERSAQGSQRIGKNFSDAPAAHIQSISVKTNMLPSSISNPR